MTDPHPSGNSAAAQQQQQQQQQELFDQGLFSMQEAMMEEQNSSLTQSKSGQSRQASSTGSHYVEMSGAAFLHNSSNNDVSPLTKAEILQLRRLLNSANINDKRTLLSKSLSMDTMVTDANSIYSEFHETTHAWAVYAENPQRKATRTDRWVGTIIIFFQLFTYTLFILEAVDDYQKGVVPLWITHDNCQQQQQDPNENFICEAEVTSHFDAIISFSMLSIFLTPEILQASRAVRSAPWGSPTMLFACLAALEVVYAFFAATVAISYQLFIGEVTDAIEVGVGLLFVRELSARAYHGIRHKGVKQYRSFGLVVTSLLAIGFAVEAICEATLTNQRNMEAYSNNDDGR